MVTRSFVFENPPFRFWATCLAQDEDFLADVRPIIELDEDSYLRLADAIAKSDGFQGNSNLDAIASACLGDDAERIGTIIHKLGGIVHDAGIDAMDELAQAIAEKAKGLDIRDRRKLVDRLHKLVASTVRTPTFVPPSFAAADPADLSAEELLFQLREPIESPRSDLLCAVELTCFEPSQQEVLLPLLWRYILAHRDSNSRDELMAAGAAIRKYIALLPMDRMNELAVLLESGHRSTLPIELEIEVAKMIFRNFEVHPPVAVDTQPELAQRLFEIMQAYVNPRILLRDKHSAAASLAVEAIVAMRSSLAVEAWQAAVRCPYRWFAELVSDDLDDLHENWRSRNSEAAAWLGDLRRQVLKHA